MCGIAGIFNTDGQPISTSVLKRMTDVIEHRGPDGEGIWHNTSIGLGHRRLSILDLSSLGDQPMQSANGRFIIIYNGEIYNFRKLKTDLASKGYEFRSKTDTEVVLNSFIEWGKECVKKFNGMFAFTIWDKKDKELFVARDRYGIKPFYYYYRNDKFIFGSEIKSIIQHPDVSVNVSLPALNEYFSFQNIFTDLTLFDGIKLLPPASYMIIKAREYSPLEIKKYWDYNFSEDGSIGENDAIEETHRLFEQSVNRQLVSDVEVGAYLSGGMDSGAITSIAAKNFNDLKTFTCGFDLSSASGLELSFDEREKAEYLSYLYKTEHYQVVLKAGDMERVMPNLIWHLEDLRVGQCYPNYYISRLASKFVKVSLSGTGGDEIFAGYPWRYYRAATNDYPEDYLEKYYKYWQRLIPDGFKSNFYIKEVYSQLFNHHTKDVFKAVMRMDNNPISSPEEYINRSLHFESKTFMHGLLEVEDKLSMAHSLETRVPFLDNDLVDFAMRIPVRYKLKNLTDIVKINENEPGPKIRKYFEKTNDGKIILRKVLSRYVPEYYTNGIKQGFSAPDASWFKGESIEYIKNMLLARNASIYEYLEFKIVKDLLYEHFEGKQNRRLLIWSLLCFEWWLRIFINNRNEELWKA